KAFTRTAAQAVFLPQRIPGWGFDAETLFLAKRFGFDVREIPVEYSYLAEGSKIRPYRDGARMFFELLLVRWYAMTDAYPRRAPAELLVVTPSSGMGEEQLSA